jgi:hypothetical protein
MAGIDTFTTPDDGWGLVSHYLGHTLLGIRISMEKKFEGWKVEAQEDGQSLIGRLEKIVGRLNEYGHADDAKKVQELLDLVKDSNMTDPEALNAIGTKHLELNDRARALEEKVRELFQK